MITDTHVHARLSRNFPFDEENILARLERIEWFSRLKGIEAIIYTDHLQDTDFWEVQKLIEYGTGNPRSIPGAEITLENGTDVTVTGSLNEIRKLDGSFSKNISKGYCPKLSELGEVLERFDLSLISAHHLRKGGYRERNYVYFDAVELDVKNPEKTEKIKNEAEKHSLKLLSGSDAHLPNQVGIAWTELEDIKKLKSTEIWQTDNCDKLVSACEKLKEEIMNHL